MDYILITGATSGIGYELARKFASTKKNIILVSSSQSRLEVAKEKLQEEFGVDIITYEQDLSEIGSAENLYHLIKKDKREVLMLINNAGFGLVGATEKIELDRDEKMMILNMITLVKLSKLFISDMYNKKCGKILNIASTGAFQPGPYTSTYFASKSFVLSYSKAIRYEAKKKGVQVCTLCPGATSTNFFKQEGTKIPINAMLPEQVADYAYRRLMKNKAVSIPGVINRIKNIFPEMTKVFFVANMKK